MNKEEILSFFIRLITIPAYSREERDKADWLEFFLRGKGVSPARVGNNVYVISEVNEDKPLLMLNSHLDTVRPNSAYSFEPHEVHLKGERIYGLGTNDAGASLVALLLVYLQLKDDESLACRLGFLASAEEEISGSGGIVSVLNQIPADAYLVGEPTGMKMAVAEKGLMVIDLVSRGVAGHAAHETGANAVIEAAEDICRLKEIASLFKESDALGPVRLTPSVIHAGKAHNMVPEICEWTLDVRTNECNSHEFIEQQLKAFLRSEVKVRSSRLKPSFTPSDHYLVRAAESCGIPIFSSSTLSDQALIPCTSVKIGPGDTHRSHSADEYIEVSELLESIEIYTQLIKAITIR